MGLLDRLRSLFTPVPRGEDTRGPDVGTGVGQPAAGKAGSVSGASQPGGAGDSESFLSPGDAGGGEDPAGPADPGAER